MNPMDIMKGLNGIQDSFVVDAQDFRQGKRRMHPVSHKKLWLIAAIIALALLLVGCTVVYVLRLQDMAFGQDTQEVLGSGVQDRTLLSLQGVKGTPGYQATKEWHEWLKTYDPDDRIYHSQEAFSEDFGDDYYAYNLYTREMKDKLDEICGKYHLNLLGKMYVDPDEAAACKALGIGADVYWEKDTTKYDKPTAPPPAKPTCASCGKPVEGFTYKGEKVTAQQAADRSKKKYGRILCMECAKKQPKEDGGLTHA